MIKNCLLCGVGGQGTVLAAKVLADAAINKGSEVKTTETIGMAQRGGSVVSHVRIGNDIHSPLIPVNSADIIIGFEPAEVVRNLAYLKEDGVVIVSSKAVKPVTATLSNSSYEGTEMIDYIRANVSKVIIVDGEAICEECNSPRVLNVALLGAGVATGKLDISIDEVKQALLKRLPEKVHDINIKALELGKELV